MLKKEITKKGMILVISFMVTLGLFLYFHSFSPFIYQTNDDFFLKTIAAGEVTGTPEAMLLHMGYLSGAVIRLLYQMFPESPCYGIFMCCSYGVTIFVVLYSLLTLEKTKLAKILTIAMTCLVTYAFLFLHIAEMQYTTITGMVSAGALFLFALSENEDTWQKTLLHNIGFLFLSLWAFSMRDKAFLMVLPFVGMIALGKYLDAGICQQETLSDTAVGHKKWTFLKQNKKRKSLLLLGLVFILVLAFVWEVKNIAYGSASWSSFRQYTTDRETIYDYDGYPAYDTHQDLYQEIGITEASYEAASEHYSLIFDPLFNQQNMALIANTAEAERKAELAGNIPAKIKSMVAALLDRNLSYTDRPLNLLVYSLYFMLFLAAIVGYKKIVIRDIFFLFLARMVTWTYLLYIDRMPSRVTQALYLAELMVLLAISFRRKIWETRWIWYLTILLVVFLSFRFGIPKAKAAASEAASRESFSDAFIEMKEYFEEHSENFYYLDMNSFGSFTEEVLKSGENSYENFLFMGSWVANSPWYTEKFDQEGITNPALALLGEDDTSTPVYAVFMKTDDTSWDYLEKFYEENYPGSHLEVEDEVTTSSGITFEIVAGKRE